MSYSLPGYDAWLTNAPEGIDVDVLEDEADRRKVWGERGCSYCEGTGIQVDEDDGRLVECRCSISRAEALNLLGEGIAEAAEAALALAEDEAEPLPDDGHESDASMFGPAGAL